MLHRDGHVCSVPGCRNALYLDLHHLIPRGEGGDANAKVFSALRNLGFREAEARGVLNQLRRYPYSRRLDTAALLRAALERLGARRAGCA